MNLRDTYVDNLLFRFELVTLPSTLRICYYFFGKNVCI